MRFPQVKRSRSVAWTGVFLFALLLVGVYVLFDILDVDGSQMTGWPVRDMLVGMTQPVDAERFFHVDLSALRLTDFILSFRTRLPSAEMDKRSTGTTLLRIRQSRWLPHMNPCHKVVCTNSPTADPA